MTEFGNSIDTNSTRNRQQDQNKHENTQEKNIEYHNNEENYYYNNNPARARACAREAAQDEQGQLPGREIMEKIAEAYRQNINSMITKAAAGIIERALKAGMEPSTVILAIEETGMASRPSPYYLSAVLRNWAESGVVVSRRHGHGADIGTTEARPWWR